MNDDDDGGRDEKRTDERVPSREPVTQTGKEVKTAAETGKPDKSESIAAETLQRVKMTEVWMIVLTAVIAVAAVVTAWVYWQQLGVMQDTLDEIRIGGVDTHALVFASGKQARAMTESIGPATTSAAIAARASAKNSDRIARGSEAAVKAPQLATRLGQRAWIGVSSIAGKPVAGEKLAIVVAFHNSGKTPALETNVFVFAAAADKGAHPIFAEARAAKVEITSRGLLPPDGIYTATGTMYSKTTGKPYILTEADVAAVNDGASLLYVHALMTYKDIFRPCVHWSMACYRYNPKLIGNQYDACDWGNLVDANCEPPPPPPS